MEQLAQIHRQTKNDHLREFKLMSTKKMMNRTSTGGGAGGGMGRGKGTTSFIDRQFEGNNEEQ